MTPRRQKVSTLAAGLTLALAATARAQESAPPNLPAPASVTERALSPDSNPPTDLNAVPDTAKAINPEPVTPPTTAPPAAKPRESPVLAPIPRIANLQERSGLISRFTAIVPHLPPDARRDQWYDTRWGDPPNIRKHKNFYPNGGLYGLPWKAECTASIAPYFYGSPGQSSLGPDCIPHHNLLRLPRSILHPFKPIGMYYDQGSYVPVYDLDPIVPGPGAWPWPYFRRLTNWGG